MINAVANLGSMLHSTNIYSKSENTTTNLEKAANLEKWSR